MKKLTPRHLVAAKSRNTGKALRKDMYLVRKDVGNQRCWPAKFGSWWCKLTCQMSKAKTQTVDEAVRNFSQRVTFERLGASRPVRRAHEDGFGHPRSEAKTRGSYRSMGRLACSELTGYLS